MTRGQFQDYIDSDQLFPETVQLLLILESNGWIPRGIRGNRAVVYWPENQRWRQIYIETKFPLNPDRITFLEAQVGFSLTTHVTEEQEAE